MREKFTGKQSRPASGHRDLIRAAGFSFFYIIRAVFLFPVLFFFCALAIAQSFPYKYYDITKIQSNEVIKGISKDQQGFIWLATDQGVLNFDGNTTRLFFKELPSPFTKTFLQRKNGQFLVLTDFGIKEIIHNQDTTYFRPVLTGDKPFTEILSYPKSLFEDSEGNLWVGEVDAVVKISDQGFRRYKLGPKFQSINYHRSFSFTEDAFGHLWIAPYKGPLLSYNKTEDQLTEVETDYPLSEVTCMINWKGDHLIIGGREGLLRLKTDSDKKIQEKELLQGPENVSAAIAVGNQIFAGTWDSGLYQLDLNEEPRKARPVEGLPFNDILGFEYDEHRNELWITGSENIGVLKSSVIRTIGEAGKYRVESLAFDSAGVLYLSTGSQILRLNKEGKADVVYSSGTTYFDYILGEGDKLWIGNSFGGISFYDLSENKLVNVWDSTSQAVSHIFRDKAGNKWFSGLPQGIVKIDPSGKLLAYPEVPNSVVVKESPGGRIYCGGEGEHSFLYLYREEKDRFELVKTELKFPAVQGLKTEDIAFDSLGAPWLATNQGLLKLQSEKGKDGSFVAERIVLKEIDANEPLKAIAITGKNVWLAYSHALAAYHEGEVIFYTPENGLPSRLLMERCFLERENELFIATAKGLAHLAHNGRSSRQTPVPLFRGMLVNGEKYRISGKNNVSIPYGARVEFDFVSLSYPGNNVLYQTKLAGLENAWSEPTANSSMSVFGFTEGAYTLQVRARDTGNLWSEPLMLNFSVSTPWFRTWWAFLLFGLAGVLLVLTSVKVYHFHLIGQKKRLKRIVEDRTKEINFQKNEIIEQKNKIIRQKEELIEKNNAVFKSEKALSEADLNYLHLKEKQLQDQIEYRNKQITTHTLNIIQKNEMLKELRDQLEGIVKSSAGAPHNELKKLLKIIDESFRLDKDWEEFKLYFEQIYTGFYAKLKVSYPELTNQELRHCALIRLNLSNNECASILGIGPNSIKVSRTRLRKKLNLENHQSLTDFVMGI